MITVNAPTSKTDSKGAAKLCLWFFLGAVFASTGYILTTGRYNGDFMGVPVTLSLGEFSLSFIASVAPYLLGYFVYQRFSRRASPPTVRVSNALLGKTFFAVTIWFIVLAISYGVGAMGEGEYYAPAMLKPVIQITNRINPFYLGVFFIVGYQGSRKTIALGITLLIILGLLRGGLGVFMYIFLALVIRNHRNIRSAVRRHFFKIALSILAVPFVTTQLYSLRADLRGTEGLYAEISMVEMVGAILVGRLSSISDSSFIMQERAQFKSEAKQLDPWYFQQQLLAPLLGIGVVPEIIPERLLINAFGGQYFNVSYMAGVPGNLLMAWFIHPLIALINAITILTMMLLSFFFANKLNLPYRNEVCFMLLLYPLTSGVSNEFSFIPVFMIALIILFKMLRLLGKGMRAVRA